MNHCLLVLGLSQFQSPASSSMYCMYYVCSRTNSIAIVKRKANLTVCELTLEIATETLLIPGIEHA